ncbi:hypothetical protein [Sphaerimonospora thailandensis]|nr:hypothetical protein [Sphaerimonospora thailandensis]
MKPTRKMLISTGVVGAVLIGGVTVTAAASANRLQEAATQMTARHPGLGDPAPSAPRGETENPASPRTITPIDPDPDVVSKDLDIDPEDASDYWTTQRMQDADPMPGPQVSLIIPTPTD